MHRVALIGTGNIAATHAAALAALDTVRIEAVMDLDPQRAQSFVRNWNIGRTYDSLLALLDAGVADVAHVLVPNVQPFRTWRAKGWCWPSITTRLSTQRTRRS